VILRAKHKAKARDPTLTGIGIPAIAFHSVVKRSDPNVRLPMEPFQYSLRTGMLLSRILNKQSGMLLDKALLQNLLLRECMSHEDQGFFPGGLASSNRAISRNTSSKVQA